MEKIEKVETTEIKESEKVEKPEAEKVEISEDLQIRRPNKLYEIPLKKNLALLFDVLMYKFYVLEPKNREFKISWVDLQKNFEINTANKNHIKEKLQELQDLNLISDLVTWNYGFSYKFEKTFLSYEEILSPKTWTFLNYSVMKKLDFISYKLYTLAYKFFDFTKGYHHKFENQTKFMETIDFLKLFNQSSGISNGVSQNRLLKRVRDGIEALKEFGIEIELHTKSFGKPITAIKILFKKVPKLKKIVRKTVDFTIQKVRRALKGAKSIFNKEDWREYSQLKNTREREFLYENTKDLTMKNFVVEDLFPAIVRSNISFLQETKEWILNKFSDIETGSYKMTFPIAKNIIKRYMEDGMLEKLVRHGVFDQETTYLKTEVVAENKRFFLFGNHPITTNVTVKYGLLTIEKDFEIIKIDK
jgi:hypothetical protein